MLLGSSYSCSARVDPGQGLAYPAIRIFSHECPMRNLVRVRKSKSDQHVQLVQGSSMTIKSRNYRNRCKALGIYLSREGGERSLRAALS